MEAVGAHAAADVAQANAGQKRGFSQRDHLDLLKARRAPGEGRARGASDGNTLVRLDSSHGSLPHDCLLSKPFSTESSSVTFLTCLKRRVGPIGGFQPALNVISLATMARSDKSITFAVIASPPRQLLPALHSAHDFPNRPDRGRCVPVRFPASARFTSWLMVTARSRSFTDLCGDRHSVQSGQRIGPAVHNYNVGYLAGRPVLTGPHRYVENALVTRTDSCICRGRHNRHKTSSRHTDQHLYVRRRRRAWLAGTCRVRQRDVCGHNVIRRGINEREKRTRR